MKKLLSVLLLVLVLLVSTMGVLRFAPALVPGGLMHALGLVDDAAGLVNLMADYQTPEGQGSLQQGHLPEDHVPDAETRYSFPQEFYPYQAMLNAEEQTVYAQVYGNAWEGYSQFPLHNPVSPEALKRVMIAVLSDHPALFWLEMSYGYSYNSDNLVVSATLFYNDAAINIEQSKTLFDGATQAVVQAAQNLASDVEKEKYVHDYLLDNVSYNLAASMNQSAYSALVNGQSVCSGYARAFQYLMQQLGVPTYFCSGYAGEDHAWNIIKLDGEYYHVDVTWDDPLGNTSGARYYDYFNLTDAEISRDHTRDALSAALPACNGTTNSYANVFGADEVPDAEVQANVPLLQTPEQAGFSREGAMSSLDAYYAHCEETLVALGEGTHTFAMLIETESLLRDILRETESQTAPQSYVPGAAARLGFAGYTASVSLQAEELTEGYWLLTQQIVFSAAQGTAA